MEKLSTYKPVVTVRVKKNKVFFGPGVYMLLKQLENSPSMKSAAEACKISYSKSWRILNNAKRELGYDLIKRSQGGKNGGACVLSDEGKRWIEQYEQVVKSIEEYSKQLFSEVFG